MLKKVVLWSFVALVVFNIIVHFNRRCAMQNDNNELLLKKYDFFLSEIVFFGAKMLPDIDLLGSRCGTNVSLHNLLKREKTILLFISDKYCHECNLQKIEIVKEKCDSADVDLLVLMSDAYSRKLINELYKEQCYLVKKNDDNIMTDFLGKQISEPSFCIAMKNKLTYGHVNLVRVTDQIVNVFFDAL